MHRIGFRLAAMGFAVVALLGSSRAAFADDEHPDDAKVDPHETPPDEDSGHVRWGISGSGGTFFPGPTTVAFGIEGRVGYAPSSSLSIYGSLGSVGGIGFGESNDGNGNASASISAVSYWYVAANIDAMVAGPLFVGAGVGVGRGAWASESASTSVSGSGSVGTNGVSGTETVSETVTSASGFMPQVDARIGLLAGGKRPNGTRSGFSVSVDLRLLIATDSEKVENGGGGNGASQSATSSTTAIGFSPMLLLGYDYR